ncbi:MAG: ABC transporter ATP-binding protein [Candidatus Omnitrophica bacterium]|nr:ABC transporter ATP-binding protein [Candidatus Omnitrophota bacterium]
MFKLLAQVKNLFGKEDHPKFFGLFLGIALNSLFEIIGIGLILPLIALLGRPGLLTTNPTLSKVYNFFHCPPFSQFMIAIAFGVLVVFVVKNIILFFLSYWQTRFINEKQVFLVSRLFRAYLMSPYSFHLKVNLAQLQRNLAAVNGVMQFLVLQIFNALTEIVLVACLFIVLLLTNALLTIVVVAVLGVSMFFYLRFFRNRLYRWGENYNRNMALLMQQMNQGLGSIKEAKLLGKEYFFANQYQYYWEQIAQQTTKSDVVTKSPRLFIETVVISLMMAAMIIYLSTGQAPERIFTTISLFAIVAIRLMPSLNRISAAWGTIKGCMPVFATIYDDLVNCEKMGTIQQKRTQEGQQITFQEKITMDVIDFSYESTKKLALEHVSLTILKNSTVGFVGPSGAGKTTAVDIILGLLEANSGEVKVDGINIQRNLRAWQKKIGYIPQAIYLCDDSIKTNIAFGVNPADIDEEKVRQALRLAQLDEFINCLPDGLETTVGERGIRLSGGQRQRIGIARALYNNPQVLVMDEATAALDNETEHDFMDALNNLSKDKTIIIIAHRLTTVSHCDKIFFLKDGKLIAEGKYQQLLSNCPEFRQMAGAGHF